MGRASRSGGFRILLKRQLLRLLLLIRQEVGCRAEESGLRHDGSERWCIVLQCVSTDAVVGGTGTWNTKTNSVILHSPNEVNKMKI